MASPDKIIAHGTDIYKFLPQRPPMVMIDTLISCADKITTTSLKILNENVFVKNGVLAEPGIIENIAQTAAAGLGYGIANNVLLKEIPIGVIGAIKDLNIFFLPKTGDIIITEVTVAYEVLNASIIIGKVFAANRLVAECEMKIFLIDGQNN
jgi:predicted hotdog family 3-hydroxylacyl-ACP dehydratase